MEKILIFVPGYNVEKTLPTVFNKLIQLRKKLSFDILYVDNKSSDESASIAEQLAQEYPYFSVIINQENKGYGGSQKVGFDYAFQNGYTHLIEYDGDYQYPAEALLKLIEKHRETNASITFGSRVNSTENLKQMPKWKQFGNKLLNTINNWAFNFGVSEIHTGFRIYNLRKLNGFNYQAAHNDYRWTMDSVIEAMKVNPTFSEISIECFYHEDASAPNFKELWKVTSYMVTRGFQFKIFKK